MKEKITYYACDTDTLEVFRAHPRKCIADVQSHFRLTWSQAEEMLLDSTIDSPVKINDCEIWIEIEKVSTK